MQALAVLGLLLGLVPPAAAEQSPATTGASADSEESGPVTDSYTTGGSAGSGELASAAAGPSPSGCVQQANDPHGSHHQPGRMNGEVRATCNNPVPHMHHTAQLWETRWWGWDRIGVKGTFDEPNVSRGSAFGNDDCRNNRIRLTGDGEVRDLDGRTYYAGTESKHIDNPCRL